MKMKNKNKLNVFFDKFVNNLYIIIFSIIFIVILFFSYKNYACKKLYLTNNIILLFIGIIICFIIYRLINRIKIKSGKKINVIFIILTIVLIPFLFCYTRNYLFITGWDVDVIRRTSTSIVKNEPIWSDYFAMYPNNMLLTYILTKFVSFSNILNIQHIDNLFLLINCFIFSITNFLVFKITYNIYKSYNKAIFAYILCFALVTLSPWICVMYSDTLGLFLLTLGVYLFIKKENASENKKIIYFILYTFVLIFGYFIKPQVFIFLIAIFLYKLTKFKFSMLKNKYFWIKSISFILIFCCITTLVNQIKQKPYFYTNVKESNFGIEHYLMMGHNLETRGIYSYDDVVYSESFKTKKERKKGDLKLVRKRINGAGVLGLISLYTDKTLTNYNDGSFAFGCEGNFYKYKYSYGNKKVREALQSYYLDGDNQIIFFTVQQIIWLAVLFLNLLSLSKTSNEKITIMKLAIIGLSIFELLFEARARYLFAYAPVYIIIGINGTEKFDIILLKRKLKKKYKKVFNK